MCTNTKEAGNDGEEKLECIGGDEGWPVHLSGDKMQSVR